jgi:F420H(2)-dependent biliverdin reductase
VPRYPWWQSDARRAVCSTGAVKNPTELAPEAEAFLAERHLGTLSTTRPDGSLHVCAIGFTWDPAGGMVRVITRDGSQKVRNVEASGRAAVAQVDGGRWLSLEGPARVARDPAAVAAAVARYTARYQEPRPNPERVAIEITVARVLGRA